MQVSLFCVSLELKALGYEDVCVCEGYVKARSKLNGETVYTVNVYDCGLVTVEDMNGHYGRHRPSPFYTANTHAYICLALNNR